MNFQTISQKMKESLAVRLYIYVWITITIAVGIGAFIFLITQDKDKIISPILTNPLVAGLISLGLILILIFSFIFHSNILLLRDFIEGNPTGIKFQIGAGIVFFIAIPFLYKYITEKYTLIGFIIVLLLILFVVILDFLRLKEIKQPKIPTTTRAPTTLRIF